MTSEMDKGIGKMMERLEQLGLAENTMVWFLSDNGGLKRTSDNRPLRGAKGACFEGVLRVGDYKLIVRGRKVLLFNLKDDLSETTDLSKQQPECVQSMMARWKTLDELSQPLYFVSEEKGENACQYAEYEWLKGTPHYGVVERTAAPGRQKTGKANE